MTYEQALQIAIEELDDAVDYLRAMNKGFPKVEKQVEGLVSASDVLKEMQANREWVGLTDEEEDSILMQCHMQGGSYLLLFRLVEAKLKEKNT